jgi:hypothetical protein
MQKNPMGKLQDNYWDCGQARSKKEEEKIVILMAVLPFNGSIARTEKQNMPLSSQNQSRPRASYEWVWDAIAKLCGRQLKRRTVCCAVPSARRKDELL